MNDIKAVVFDFDGTLYDSKNLAMHLILSDIFTAKTLQAERKARKSLSGCPFDSADDYYTTLFSRMSELTGKPAEKMRLWYDNNYMPRMARVLKRHYTMRPGLEGLLTGLRKKGIKTAIFTDYGCTESRISAIGVKKEWFDLIADAPTCGGLKPCKDSFDKVAELLGLRPEEILMVGDRDDTDIEGTRRAGMQSKLLSKDENAWDNLYNYLSNLSK